MKIVMIFYLSGHPGDVWVVGNNPAGVSWINRVSGTGKTAAEAQAIVDGEVENCASYLGCFICRT